MVQRHAEPRDWMVHFLKQGRPCSKKKLEKQNCLRMIKQINSKKIMTNPINIKERKKVVHVMKVIGIQISSKSLCFWDQTFDVEN